MVITSGRYLAMSYEIAVAALSSYETDAAASLYKEQQQLPFLAG